MSAAGPREGDAARGRLPAWLLIGALLASLLVGFWIKNLCTTHAWDGYQFRTSCYSDIFALYPRTDDRGRSLERGGFPYTSLDFEYPAGTGLFVGAVARRVHSDADFLKANALGLAVFGLAGAAALVPMVARRRRILYYALAPSMVLYAFHNWDLLAVGFAVAALYAFWRGSDPWAGALAGLGAATKVFPGLLLPAMALARWRERRRVPWGMLVASAAGFAALNLPLIVANRSGWWYPWKFQSTRFPNIDNSWYHACRLLRGCHGLTISGGFWANSYASFTGYASVLLFLAGTALLVWREARRERTRPYALAFGIILVFLLTAKVFSPQYALWVLPFFALIEIPWYGFAAFAASEAAVWVTISYFFLGWQGPGGEARLALNGIAVFARAAVLAWLLWRSRSAREVVREPQR